MFETAQKYSELAYYSKQEIEHEMDHYLVEPLWQEILAYRSIFQKKFPIGERKTYIVRNPMVNDAIGRTQELIIKYVILNAHKPLYEIDMFWLKEEEIFTFQNLLSQIEHQKVYDHNTMLLHFIEQMHVQKQLSISSMKYLQNIEHNLLLQLFLVSMECDKKTSFILMFPILKGHHVLSLANVITMEELSNLYDKKDQDLDVTRSFLSFLSCIRLKLSNEMVSLKAEDDNIVQQMQMNELILRYPMLQKEQIQFYVEHRTLHHFYTLQEYMNVHHVCYETARYSMEKLVEMKWYQKQKIGKKFVYYIV